MATPRWSGFTRRLKTAADLVQKLEHDLGRMRANPADVYAAFDFYVTADSWVDWRWPDRGPTRDAARAEARADARGQEPMATASHLANGAKHFEARAERHRSVHDVSDREGYFDPAYFQADAFDVGGVDIVRPSGNVDAVQLAEEVLDWIRRHSAGA